jgi:predicted metal-dependent enzyme (double-stranded beta helix superfamily)/ribosomal protein S18 acetylase RimI-like enzyme
MENAEFVLDVPVVRTFVAEAQAAIASTRAPAEACDAIRPAFAALLADPDWLPAGYRAPAPESGMGGGIGQWLLYRSGDASLCLFSLVVPPDAETPIHDHLAWGLVGLYQGAQEEEIYARRNGTLELVERRGVERGDFYVLIPPDDDIHRVRTTSAETSVSIHLLTNDTGCVWRHSFDVESGEARPFRSGYVNVACADPTVEIRTAMPEDFESVYELLCARSAAAFGSSELQRENLALEWQLANTDRVVATKSGEVVGYAELSGAHDLVLAARDDEVNDALLNAVERRARERGFDTLVAMVVPEDVPLHALVSRAGFAEHSEVLRMWRPLDAEVPEPVWPDGVTVRTFTDSDAQAVQALLDEAYTAWDDAYVPRPHDDWLQWMTEHDEFDPTLWFLVDRDADLVACGLYWRAHEGRGWVKDLVVRKGERGRGLGKALLHHAFAEYRRRGAERIGLKVDAGNPTGAPGLYERVGFVTDRRYGTWVKRL